MTISVSNQGITFNDNTTQNTAAVVNSVVLLTSSSNNSIISGKSGTELRFKRIAVANNGFNEVTASYDLGGSLNISYVDASPPPMKP